MVLFGLFACVISGGEQSFEVAGVDAVAVVLSNGEVDIVSAERDDVAVHWEGGGISADGVFETEVVDGQLFVDADCGVTCGGEIHLEVPEGTPIYVEVEAGEAHVDLRAPADVCAVTAAGELSITVPRGAYALDLQVGAGELSIVDVTDDGFAAHSISATVATGELSLIGK